MKNTTIALLAAAALTSLGCDKDKKASTDEGSGDKPSAPTKSASSAAAKPAAEEAKVGEGPVVKSATLAKLTMSLPKPKGAPESGAWKTVPGGKDGRRMTNYGVGSDMWLSLDFLDCNQPLLKDYIKMAPSERGAMSVCFDKPTGKLKDYPMLVLNDDVRAIKVGHVAVICGVAANAEGKLKGADVEAYLSSLDLSSLTDAP